MKKLLLSVLAFSTLSLSLNAQIIARVVSPASIEGGVPFTWADPTVATGLWTNTPNFNIVGTWIEDTLAIVEDGTPGNSTTTVVQHALSQEGCGTLTNPAAIAGKIAVVYRGTCSFAIKALNAQNAGAVGVIIINRDLVPLGMTGNGTVSIPVVQIGRQEGIDITAAMATQTVTAFLGNKRGIYANDLTSNANFFTRSKYASIPNGMTKHLDFSPAIRYYNIGSTAQVGTTVNCKITGPGVGGATVYDETSIGLDVPVDDSVTLSDAGPYVFPTFDYDGLTNGEYTVTYTILNGAATDDDDDDNVFSTVFNVNANILSYTRLDANNIPINTNYPATAAGSTPGFYNACMSIRKSDSLIPIVQGLHFSISSDTSVAAGNLTNQEITFGLYEWLDPTTYTSISQLLTESIFLTDNSDNAVMKYHTLATPWQLNPNLDYLVCVATVEHDLFRVGSDNSNNYQGNFEFDSYVTGPWSHGAAVTWTRWSGGTTAGIGVQMQNVAYLGVDNQEKLYASVYPNPTTDKLTLRVNVEGNVNITVTDLSGKVVTNTTATMVNGSTELNTNNYEAGMYIVNITANDGTSTKVNVVKR